MTPNRVFLPTPAVALRGLLQAAAAGLLLLAGCHLHLHVHVGEQVVSSRTIDMSDSATSRPANDEPDVEDLVRQALEN